MASPAEISIPSVQASTTATPYTQYNVCLRLPLRSFTLSKRYSDFVALHAALAHEASAPPPATLPPKSYLPFASTAASPARIEARRLALEAYLRTLATHPDARWRTTSAWRTFLNLPRAPSSVSASSSSSVTTNTTTTTSSRAGNAADPTIWLDLHRDVQAQLHDARQHLTQRAQHVATEPAAREAAAAKACLVRAGSLITALARALEPGAAARGDHGNNNNNDGWGGGRLGDGEARRRGDLVAAARNELAALEALAGAMAAKGQADATVAEKNALVNGGGGGGRAASAGRRTGRILGGETARTRELDNGGVVGLQQQMMREQDEDVEMLAQAVRRQKELAEQINGELAVQNELLAMADEDVTRVAGKLAVARKRVTKIS